MNERYAVDPQAPTDMRELKLLFDQFGLQTGRFVAQYPPRWLEELSRKSRAWTPVDIARAAELLSRRKSALLPIPRAPFEPDLGWADNVDRLHRKYQPFDGIVGQRENGNGWPSIEAVLYEEECRGQVFSDSPIRRI